MSGRLRSFAAAMSVLAFAVLSGEAAPPAAVTPISQLKFLLMDGSLVAGNMSVSDLTIDTQFGPLKIPLDQIKSFTPGLNSHPAYDKQITDYVNDLASEAFADREKAQQALIKIGPEIRGELQRQIKTAESEKQTRLQKILDEFDSQREGDDEIETAFEWMRDDVVVTNAFTVVGHITTPAFSVTSPYGTLQVKINDIRQAKRDAAEPEDIRKTITVSGTAISQHAFESSLRVNRGDQVTVAATGTITMTPWGNVPCTPEGGQNFGMVQPGNIPGGALVARIGNGELMKIGSKASFKAEKTGVLQFGIAVQGDYGSYQFPGEFQVKVRVTRK